MQTVFELIDWVIEELEHVAPGALGAANVARNEPPCRYVWILRSVTPEPTRNNSFDPRIFYDDVWSFDVLLHGKTLADCAAMRAALVSCLINAGFEGRFTLGTMEHEPDLNMHLGVAMTQPIAITLPMAQVTYPTAATAELPSVSVEEWTSGEGEIDAIEAQPGLIASSDGDGFIDPEE